MLKTGAADGEYDLDVAARRPRVGAGLVRPAHQAGGFVAVNLRRVEVERSQETEAALLSGPMPTRAVMREPVRSSLRPEAIRSSADWKHAA